MDEELNLAIVKKKEINIIKNIVKAVIILLFPIVLFLSIELLNGMDLQGIKIAQTLFGYNQSMRLIFMGIKNCIKIIYTYYIGEKWINILLISGLLAGIYGLTGRLRKSMIITTVITMILAIVNYLLIEIRGTAITSADFYSVNMVFNMANGIQINLSAKIFISIIVVSLWLILCSKLKFETSEKHNKKIIRIIAIICFTMIFILFFATDVFDVKMSYNTNNFYQNKGVLASFLTTIKEMKVNEPEGYSVETIEEQLGNDEADKKASAVNQENKDPNIIVIMNESFSDLSEIYDLELTEDNMKFIHSMEENTIKANVYTSALGGKTANCEWEFLTGNSSKFMPIGAVAYQQYIREEVPSIVHILNNLGYNTSAFHPYNPEGYSRNIVYPLMGFNQYKFNDTMENLNLLRYDDFADDMSTYKNIINLFENKNKDEKIFNFTVTMQNHTSYWDRDFKNTVFLEKYDKEEYFDVNQYLSLIKLSDEAFKYLVEYFKDYDEPTIIMMFGDHQPGIVTNYPELFGEDKEDVYDKRKYTIPMVLWANYDIPEYEIKDTSLNYLSTILFDVAGLQKSEYMEYLQDLHEKYPVITVNAYEDSEGNFHDYEQGVPEEFKLYEYIQYNNMFDDEKLNYLFK